MIEIIFFLRSKREKMDNIDGGNVVEKIKSFVFGYDFCNLGNLFVVLNINFIFIFIK